MKHEFNENGKFISFDVNNLFPSIPPIESIILIDDLQTENYTNPIKKYDIPIVLEFVQNEIIFRSPMIFLFLCIVLSWEIHLFTILVLKNS